MVVGAPITEELLFRVGLQEFLLKRLPKAALDRFAPSYSHLVDSRGAKIGRIAFSALAFSLAHAMPAYTGWPNCSAARLVQTFVAGTILGGIQEVTESPLLAMAFHAGNNVSGGFLLDNLGIQMFCPEVL